MLVSLAERRGAVHCCGVLSLAVSDLRGFGDRLLDLLEGLLSLWMAILVRMKLNGNLVVVLLDILLALLRHALDKQGQRRKHELVGQIHLIVTSLFLNAAISSY